MQEENQYIVNSVSTSKTLGEVFLDVMEAHATEQMRDIIQVTRTYMAFPDYAELFSVLVINALGYTAQISENKFDNAMAFLIRQNELSIRRINGISDEEKQRRKQCMIEFITTCKEILKEHLKQRIILIP